MRSYAKLPEAYRGRQISRIELERSRILSRLIKTVQAVLAVLLLAAGCLFMPPAELTGMADPFKHLFALMLGMLSVSVVHELGRGLLMRLFSGVKPTLRFAGAYLHAGCDAYFPRREEQMINLAPILLLTVILIALLLSAPDATWRWMVWIVMIVNLCFAVGNIYASVRFTRMPDDILVQNVGPTYLVYSATAEE